MSATTAEGKICIFFLHGSYLSDSSDKAPPITDEINKINDVLKHYESHNLFDIYGNQILSRKDIVGFFPGKKPKIIHFSGRNNFGSDIQVPQRLIDILKQKNSQIKCIFLNACFSDDCANQIVPHANCVIGIPPEFSEEDAVSFAGLFYNALGYGADIGGALAHAKSGFTHNSDEEKLRVVVKNESAYKVVLISEQPWKKPDVKSE
jgi:hypothetical protein